MAFLVDAAMGAVIGELLKVVMDARLELKKYRAVLESIATKLSSITLDPEAERIKELNEVILAGGCKEMQKLWETIKNGEKLLRKCSQETGRCCSLVKSPRYMKEVKELDDSIDRFYRIVMTDTFVKVKQVHDQVKNTHEDVKNIKERVEEGRDQAKETKSDVKGIKEKMSDIDKKLDVVIGILKPAESVDKVRNDAANSPGFIRPQPGSGKDKSLASRSSPWSSSNHQDLSHELLKMKDDQEEANMSSLRTKGKTTSWDDQRELPGPAKKVGNLKDVKDKPSVSRPDESLASRQLEETRSSQTYLPAQLNKDMNEEANVSLSMKKDKTTSSDDRQDLLDRKEMKEKPIKPLTADKDYEEKKEVSQQIEQKAKKKDIVLVETAAKKKEVNGKAPKQLEVKDSQEEEKKDTRTTLWNPLDQAKKKDKVIEDVKNKPSKPVALSNNLEEVKSTGLLKKKEEISTSMDQRPPENTDAAAVILPPETSKGKDFRQEVKGTRKNQDSLSPTENNIKYKNNSFTFFYAW